MICSNSSSSPPAAAPAPCPAPAEGRPSAGRGCLVRNADAAERLCAHFMRISVEGISVRTTGVRYVDDVVLREDNGAPGGGGPPGPAPFLDSPGLFPGIRLYYTQDANWNVTSLVDTTGTVVERVLYDAYGRHTLYNAAWSATQSSTLYGNDVLFAGYRYNSESGMYQVRNREYHPTLGRWVQRDPLRYVDGSNLYE